MAVIQIECDDDDASILKLLEAVKTLGRNPKIFIQRAPPKLPSATREFEARARAIAQAIKPRSNQPMRREVLEFVLNGGNTWLDQGGEPDPALRNATGALSKALRPFDRWAESPLEILCDRQRETVRTGPYKGRYQGTKYVLTPLGRRVRAILLELGVLRPR